MKTWAASVAKAHLPEIIDAAVAGDPQLIERRDGKEAVVVSLKTFLLENTYSGEGEEEFDQILRDIRGEGFNLQPRTATSEKQ